MADHDDPYEIGYKKPPAETRFTKGQSGNPKGRPKGAKNLATLLVKVGRERVRVTINGRTRTMTKLEAILLQLANKAISGEDRAAKEILHLLSLYEESDKTGLPQPDQDEKDEATWDNIVKRILKSDSGSGDGNGGAPPAVSAGRNDHAVFSLRIGIYPAARSDGIHRTLILRTESANEVL